MKPIHGYNLLAFIESRGLQEELLAFSPQAEREEMRKAFGWDAHCGCGKECNAEELELNGDVCGDCR